MKGDIARAIFYMDIRYEGDNNEPDLELIEEEASSGCDCMGWLSTLLEWHQLDRVDDRERRRNDLIFNEFQGNRNPFIDHPEWVYQIWNAPRSVISDAEGEEELLTVCSFNIQFLGNSRYRDDVALASILEPCDIVVVQELVSPPYAGTFPDGNPFNPDPESEEFFEEMAVLGFDYILSEEDTGTGDNIHRNGSATEWWVAFYNPDKVYEATDLPRGFLADDRSNHDDYERVPYAFPFRTLDDHLDFVLISVHLMPGGSSSSAERRLHELDAISAWIENNDTVEKDFIILGDMNIEDFEELEEVTPQNIISLNDECRPTNTNVNGPKPYDHVMFNPSFTSEIDSDFDMIVIDLIESTRPFWDSTEPYPGDPYDHNGFRRVYSDHHPVVFRFQIPQDDDD